MEENISQVQLEDRDPDLDDWISEGEGCREGWLRRTAIIIGLLGFLVAWAALGAYGLIALGNKLLG